MLLLAYAGADGQQMHLERYLCREEGLGFLLKKNNQQNES